MPLFVVRCFLPAFVASLVLVLSAFIGVHRRLNVFAFDFDVDLRVSASICGSMILLLTLVCVHLFICVYLRPLVLWML